MLVLPRWIAVAFFLSVGFVSVHGKHVFIHHMVGLTWFYDKADWERDMIEAMNYGIEAFALNHGYSVWQRERLRDAYEVAETYPTVAGFKLFLSLDMDHFHVEDVPGLELQLAVKDFIDEFAARSGNFLHQGRTIVSTFSGQTAAFGDDTNAGWLWIKENVVPAIHLIPSFFIHSFSISEFPAVDGLFKWNSWQYRKGNRARAGFTDADFQTALQADNKTFMACVSPLFFTHYPPPPAVPGWDKNWYLGGDDHLLVTRWEEIIDRQPEFVQLATYNDWGESHYMTNPRGRTTSPEWVVGFDHTAFLRLSSILAKAYRSGHG